MNVDSSYASSTAGSGDGGEAARGDAAGSHRIFQWLATPDGGFVFISPEWSSLTGRSGTEGLGMGWMDTVHPDDRNALKDGFAAASAAAERESFRRRFRLRHADGSDHWTLMDAHPCQDGFIGMCMPVASSQSDTRRDDHHLSDLLGHTRLAAVELDLEGRALYANTALLNLLGYPAAEVIGRNFFDAFTPPHATSLPFPLHHDSAQGLDLPLEFETEILENGNGRHLLLWHTIVLRTASGLVRSIVLIGDDITAKRQAEERFLLVHRVFETTEMAMVVTDANVNIIAVNNAFSRLTGYSNDEVVGRNPRLLKSDRHDRLFYQRLWGTLLATGHWHGEVWDRRKDGQHYPKFLSINTIRDEHGNITNYHGIFYDISERKSIEEKLDHMAHYDPLTDLPNRTLLHERLDASVTAAARAGSKVALLYLDLDHFKEINDSRGHDVGDALLQEVARRLQQCVRSHDTVARLGGDEFVVLLVDVEDVKSVSMVAAKLLDAIAAPFSLNGQEFGVSTSIGISLYPDDHYMLDVLLKNADQAMYRAKTEGRANFKYFGELGA